MWDDRDQLCVVRNISAGGLMFECLYPPELGRRVTVELRSDKQMSGIVRWVKDASAGIAFDRPINVQQILREERSSLLRVRPRAPRFIRRGTVRLVPSEGDAVLGDIIDISIGGLSCRPAVPLTRGDPIVAVIEDVGATNGEVRWSRSDIAGIRFDKPLHWRAFQLWLDKTPRS